MRQAPRWRRDCLAALEDVELAGYSDAAIATCMEILAERLGKHAVHGGEVADQVGKLVAARNAQRAIRLVRDTPSRASARLVPALVVGTILSFPLTYFTIDHFTTKHVEKTIAEAKARPMSAPSFAEPDIGSIALGFAQDVAAGRLEAARDRLGPVERESFSTDRLRKLGRNPYLGGVQEVSIHRSTYVADTVEARGVLSSGAGNIGITVAGVKQDGRWRLVGISLGGTPLLALSATR